MKKIYPFIYKQFQCAANRCVDSCCKEWEIVIDEQTCQKYQKLNDIMGNRLRNAMVTDADGDVIFQLQHQRCPFWNQSGFCDIQTQLGESFLCHTCRLYPRISQDYGNFIEYDLSISCPEAARILLSRQWKGNIRELRNCIEKAVILAGGQALSAADIGPTEQLYGNGNDTVQPETAGKYTGEDTLEMIEERAIRASVRKYDGNLSLVARELGISRPTLYSKLKKYNI